MPSYWSKYPEIDHHITLVCQLIEKRVQARNTDIQEAIVQLAQAGGKYLRPAFFFLFTSFGQREKQNSEQLTKIAASLEILHMATLIHDDVIDDSPLRRGQVTIQTQFGKDIAVYTGDFLFTIFFELILETMQDSPYMKVNAKAMKKILVGELDQMHLYFNQKQSIRDYLRSISGKTAELFRLASSEGAYFGGASPEVVSKAGRIGYHIGMTFQILDDILDYTAKEKDFNKPILEDITNGVYSLPLLFAIKHNPDAFKELLDKKDQLTAAELRKIAELVLENGGVEKAQKLARQYTQKAIDDINELPKIKAQKQLLQLTNHLLKRKI
ncbi:polyprenyl synthetase family protein [Streptococcus pseudoporcinus]|uniref:Polyprenyl synthetase n=1 Tax=Streptococcus pseudoporcinus LQ 940-04 TaxID=875093 RepID=G5KA25_9STRE|nr:polyprenyl synthetase family protein [Streptococcus pseudoporcinus]EFR43706.1 polyprenyl synthetase [Streptococcus pseudoporcinus SPIN 20026]EHI64157.1 polyprenyl synthetase [Streptococcus pseudoporcinus LQ 940-04]VEF93765.1 polyprenyl synthetase [Streptococcus pseudoporcinus]